MRVYYTLLILMWRAIKDFGIWFIYIILVLSSVVVFVFQVRGCALCRYPVICIQIHSHHGPQQQQLIRP